MLITVKDACTLQENALDVRVSNQVWRDGSVDGEEVLRHRAAGTPGYYDPAQREVLVELAGYLAGKLVSLRPEEASAARVLGELMRGQRL